MRLAQTLNILRKEGFRATRGRIRCALSNGYLEPLPKKVACGAYDFAPCHLKQLRRYFIFVRPGPQPDQRGEFPICGQSDRINRMERKLARRREKKAFWDAIQKMENLAKSL